MEAVALLLVIESFVILVSKRLRSSVKMWSVTGLVLLSCVEWLSSWVSIDKFVFAGVVLASAALTVIAFEANQRHGKYSMRGK